MTVSEGSTVVLCADNVMDLAYQSFKFRSDDDTKALVVLQWF
jgi:hypothetical protein